jgi:D-isomer specific 2-hydroxyacid dehydrogenase, NAD binding domain
MPSCLATIAARDSPLGSSWQAAADNEGLGYRKAAARKLTSMEDARLHTRSLRPSYSHRTEGECGARSRGEIVDEDALLDALQRDHLRGAALDVSVGEFERPPMAQLWSHRRVLITPHVSNGSDENRHGGVDVFCENLRAYRDGRPLRNVIDWQRGY